MLAGESQNTRLALSFSAAYTMIGGDSEFGTVMEAVRTIVTATQNSVRLHSVLIEKTLPHLEVYAEGETLEAVRLSLPATGRDWMTAFDEAWPAASEAAMPAFVRDRAGV